VDRQKLRKRGGFGYDLESGGERVTALMVEVCASTALATASRTTFESWASDKRYIDLALKIIRGILNDHDPPRWLIAIKWKRG
jgi:hypothetical protein